MVEVHPAHKFSAVVAFTYFDGLIELDHIFFFNHMLLTNN